MSEHRAELNPAGLVSDRDLGLAKDEWTVVELSSPESAYSLVRAGGLIERFNVERLGLGISGGKIVQNKKTAAGSPVADPAKQSDPVPESVPVDSFSLPDVGAVPHAKATYNEPPIPTPAQARATAALTNKPKLSKAKPEADAEEAELQKAAAKKK